MERAVIFGGFGGQGLLFAGQVLAQAALLEGLETFWIPSYGPEMRGGTAACTVIVADRPIGSPVVDQADAAVVMNLPSLVRYAPLVRPGGLLVVNASLVEGAPGRDDIETLPVPCSAFAREAGDDRLVSVVALGALVARTGLVSPASVREALPIVLGEVHAAAAEANLAAFEAGLRAGTNASPAAAPVAAGAAG